MEKETHFITVYRSSASSRKNSFRNHRHTAFEISYIEKGKGRYRVGDRFFPISDGDIFLYHTNEPHCITDIEENAPMEILNIHFEPCLFWSTYADVPVNRYYQVFFDRSMRGENRLLFGSKLNTKVRELMTEIAEEWELHLIDCKEMIKTKLMAILITLLREEHPTAQTAAAHSLNRSGLLQIKHSMEYICTHIDKQLTLEDIAAKACMSRTYYCSVFKALNGITPWEYVNIKRIDLARSLLCDTDLTIYEIALKCGFHNSTNFNRIFKKITLLTPQQYRSANVSS